MAYIQAFIAMLPMIMKLVNLFIKTPEQKRKELITEIGEAFRKAENEKDPSDLSRIINR